MANFIRRMRQNHAVEHATLTILMTQDLTVQLVGGRSSQRGFYVFGQVETASLQAAATAALRRLQAGEAGLAIHPNCGTNLVTSSTLAGLAVITASALGRRRRTHWMEQVPMAILVAMAAILAGRPLGLRLQRKVTTLADVRTLRLGPISRHQMGRLVQHFVALEDTAEIQS